MPVLGSYYLDRLEGADILYVIASNTQALPMHLSSALSRSALTYWGYVKRTNLLGSSM